jgi:hypothetical protein
MRLPAAALAPFLVTAGCSSGTESNLADVSGNWSFTETLEDRLHGYSCIDTGTYQIHQVGDRFDGKYAQHGVCNTPQGPVDNTDSGTVDAGRVIGRTIRFMVTASCEYEGTASGMPATALAGRGICVLHDVNRTINFSGNWQATR